MRILLPVVVMLVCSCRYDGQEQTERGGESAVSDTLPDVPFSLPVSEERAAYIIAHFWDGVDFGDTLRCRNRTFMERIFVDYISLFPHTKTSRLKPCIGVFLEQAKADSACLVLINVLAEHYLDNPNSPMRNEEYYILFLEELLNLSELPEAERIRCSYSLETAGKNRPGTIATDFAYTDRGGHRCTLHATQGEHLLLVFYDPSCSHCSEILDGLSKSSVISQLVSDKKLTVLAVYTEGDRRIWNNTKASMPQRWIVAIDESGIVDTELYAIPAMPVIYLLDRDKSILLKDTFLPEIEAILKTI